MKQKQLNIVLFIFLLFLTSCGNQEPIKIGFAGEITAGRTDLGVDGRDGAILAVETINQQGGVNGQLLQLIVKDDEGKADVAQKVDAELVQQGVVAIVGHMTSDRTASVWEQLNQAKMVLISPTASSSQFTGKADDFFRVIVTTDLRAKGLAKHIYQTRRIQRLICIYDESNLAYNKGFWEDIKVEFEKLGGKTDQVFSFTPNKTDLPALMKEVKTTEPTAIMLIASPTDTALLIQYSRQLGLNTQFFATGTSLTDKLLEQGGRAVEGLELDTSYYPENPLPSFQKFLTEFEKRFRRKATFPAMYSYESVLVLAEALKQTNGQAKDLPQALLKINNLEGVQGKISFDEYGDVKRDTYIVVVKNGQFQLLDTISYQ